MTDLVERLRDADRGSQQRVFGSRIFGEAADEIERLRRHCTAMEKAITAFLPRSVAIDNPTWADGTFIPLDTSLGELRALKTARDAYLKENPRNAD